MAIITNVDTAQVTLSGTTALVLDNIEHADPDDPLAREIKKITDKGKDMTEEDRQRKDWLAYYASLYLDEADGQKRIVMPWKCISRALRTGAFRIGGTAASGKIDGGVASAVVSLPLDFNGPQDPEKLYADPQFRLREMVNKNPTGKKAMVATVRPMFPDWRLTFTLTVFNDIISWDLFERVLAATGIAVGIGNARKLGYGRFATEVTRV